MPEAPRWPRLCAHRGGGLHAPENTLAAMRAGRAHGYRMVEFDVKLSRDGMPFLLHDDRLERTTDGVGRACDHDWHALSRLDAGRWHGARHAGEPIPTLAAVARFLDANGMAADIEIKPCAGRDAATGRAIARAAAELWRDAPVPPLLTSFSEAALRAARHAAPHLPRGLLVEAVPADWRARLGALGCVAIVPQHGHLTADLVEQAHGDGFVVATYACNDPERARMLLEWGVDCVITDALALLAPLAGSLGGGQKSLP